MPSSDWAHYLAERAAAGVGLVFLTVTCIPRLRQACALYEASIPSFRAVANKVHDHGAKIFAQLHMREGGVSWEPLGAMMPLLAASDLQNFRHRHATNWSMPASLIERAVEAHGRSAENLANAGYDGIEIHVSHGMLIEMFLSPYFNRRKDEYGGHLENRMRFLRAVLREVRGRIRDDMALGIRMNCDEMLPEGLTGEDSRTVVQALAEEHLIDFVDLDIAVEPMQAPLMVAPQFVEPLYITPFAERVAEPLKGQIVRMATPGRLTKVAQAEELLARGMLDMVGAVRAQLAEPELIKNAIEGKEDRSRTCIACNFCLGATLPGRVGFGCVINPASGRERIWGTSTFTRAARSSSVVVVGAGPSGMEAARVAAKLGHEVVLYERRPSVGGQLNLWARIPGREILAETVAWYRRELNELGVRVRTNVQATAALVETERPDAVLIATGSEYVGTGESAFMPFPIPGWQRSLVYRPEQILEEGARPLGRVLILDEESIHTSWGVAEILATAGAEVEIITRDLDLVGDALAVSLEFPFVLARLMSLGVKVTTATYLKEVGDGQARLFHILTNAEELRDVDAVVLATMRRSTSTLARELEGRVHQLFEIGDALAPRYLFEATYEGHRFARLIGLKDAPRTMTEAVALFSPLPPDVFPTPAATLLGPMLADGN